MLDNTIPIVLVVDDSPDSLGMINVALNKAGYTVLVALNGKQALDIVQQIKPNVVLMDAVMPVMDGFDCCRNMREMLPLTPIIFMTGLSDVENTVKAFEHGGNDYINKPINPDELLARITAHISSANMISNARFALDSARQHVMAVNNAGELLWSTPDTMDLLAANSVVFTDVRDELKEALQNWLACDGRREHLVLKGEGGAVVLCYFKSVHADEHLLRIADRKILHDASVLESALNLTKREAEVLMWVAQGKTNKEIGEILSLSPRTVNKHLEQVFSKMYVDNRSAATSVAIQALLGMPI